MPPKRTGYGRDSNNAQAITVAPDIVTEIQERLLSWGQKHYKPYPWRHPAEGWHALVAEILLQRTKVSSVVQVYENFLVRFPTLLSLAESSVEDIEKIIYPLGLLWRAPILKRLGEQLTATNGEIPPTADILKLPGVGAYVAAAWLGFHGGRSEERRVGKRVDVGGGE